MYLGDVNNYLPKRFPTIMFLAKQSSLTPSSYFDYGCIHIGVQLYCYYCYSKATGLIHEGQTLKLTQTCKENDPGFDQEDDVFMTMIM